MAEPVSPCHACNSPSGSLACTGCGRTLCAGCSVEILGGTYCGRCRDEAIRRLEGTDVAPLPRGPFWAAGALTGIGCLGVILGIGAAVSGTWVQGLILFSLSAGMAAVGIQITRSLHEQRRRLLAEWFIARHQLPPDLLRDL